MQRKKQHNIIQIQELPSLKLFVRDFFTGFMRIRLTVSLICKIFYQKIIFSKFKERRLNMGKKIIISVLIVIAIVTLASCKKDKGATMKFTGAKAEVKLMTLDPGHFHAALVQKTTYDQISEVVNVYAPAGEDLNDHENRIKGFNGRKENPTNWQQNVYTGDDFLEKMIADRVGNVVVISGNNRKKAEYIKACVDAGLGVLADKPMCINKEGFEILEEAFASAKANGVLLYDIMTERSEITSIIQKRLSFDKQLFGELDKGSVEDPSVIVESVHHFFKYVAGNPLKRPDWFCDTNQQGEGIIDVTTHLIDLAMWGCFSEQAIDFDKDVKIEQARRWPTMINKQQYQKVTRLEDFPDFLKKDLNADGVYPSYANGEIVYVMKGIHTLVRVKWNYQAPEGAKDTHYGLMRGTKAQLIIRQGKEQNYKTQLYVEPVGGVDKANLKTAFDNAVANLKKDYPGLTVADTDAGWQVVIPDEIRIGHEAHFRQVTQRYLQYLRDGKLPGWEVPNMLTKYQITTTALEMAKAQPANALSLAKKKDKIDVVSQGKVLTSFRYADELTKPILYPVCTSSGVKITRGFPYEKIKGESTDHPHHTGIFFSYDQVNDEGFWNNAKTPPQIKITDVSTELLAGGQAVINAVMDWTAKNGKVLVKENRQMTFEVNDWGYSIDFDIDLTANEQRIVFGDNKEGMFAVRLADWFKKNGGSGKYFDSEGRKGAGAIWGHRAKWVAFQGPKDGKTVGIAIMNHPTSVNYPTFWHVRDYGLFSANPLGQVVFEKAAGAANPKPLNLTLEAGQKAYFKFKVLVYDKDMTKAELEKEFTKFTE